MFEPILEVSMKSKLFAFLVLGLGLLMDSSLMLAHHGAAAYDMAKLTTVKGTVTDYEFVNPHVEINIEVKDDKGSVEKWRAEVNTPNILARGGWNKNSLKSGDQITVVGYRAKNGLNMLRVQKVVLSNGQELDAHWGGVY
jgi:Family of unknown function (DUF6152)